MDKIVLVLILGGLDGCLVYETVEHKEIIDTMEECYDALETHLQYSYVIEGSCEVIKGKDQ